MILIQAFEAALVASEAKFSLDYTDVRLESTITVVKTPVNQD